MKTHPLNLLIVDDNHLMVAGLKNYLTNRFGNELNISTFHDGKSALSNIGNETDIVILDYYLGNENGNEILKSIKKINPATEVIMLSSNENMEIAIESYRNGAKDYVLKGDKSWKKISSLIYKTITYPLHIMVKEFGINKYIAMFLLTFITMGIGVYFCVKYIN